MNTLNLRIINIFLFFSLLPTLVSCSGGGGSLGFLSSLGSLFAAGSGFGSSGFTLLASSSGIGSSEVTGATIATIHNPEPASMLLMGSGLLAMSYFRKKSNKH